MNLVKKYNSSREEKLKRSKVDLGKFSISTADMFFVNPETGERVQLGSVEPISIDVSRTVDERVPYIAPELFNPDVGHTFSLTNVEVNTGILEEIFRSHLKDN